MLIVELNEFDPEFLKQSSKKLNLKNIQKIFNLKHSKTTTNETVEHHGLDPWVQWVSIHTGVKFANHKISRLGETKIQSRDQIWNKLSKEKNIKCGVWGVINAPSAGLKGDNFFLPDPWSFEEEAYPDSINDFLALPRYMSKNYLSPDKKKLILPFLRMLYFIFRNRGGGKTRKIIKLFLVGTKIAGINIHTLSTLLDYMSTIYFITQKNKSKTNFNIIFLNHIAHLQHQFWSVSSRITNHMKFGLIICDEIMNLLFKEVETSEQLLIINGLKQRLIEDKIVNIYRQKDPEIFFYKLGIKYGLLEQNMTNDGILIFDNTEAANIAEDTLSRIILKYKKQNLFYIERLSNLKIFYQIEISEEVEEREEIILDNKKLCNFYELIELVCQRTGEHIQEGDIFYKNIELPNKMENHEIFKTIFDNQ